LADVEIVSGGPRFALEEIRRVVASACARSAAERAILFGSYGRGSADVLSDVDLLIVCPTALPFVERYRLFGDILDAFPGTDLLVYTPEELEEMRARSGFVERAEREGIALYEAGPKAR
jgi:predicted nucleotidyltransferase